MTLQQGIDFDLYFRCYVVGQKKVHVMQYDPRSLTRIVTSGKPRHVAPVLHARVVRDAMTLCQPSATI